MISPEVLRRYPFFGLLNDAQLKQIAMISQEQAFEAGKVLFREGDQAIHLYLILAGNVDLYFTISEETADKEFHVEEIGPGEVVGISAMIEPYTYTSNGRLSHPGRLVHIDGAKLRQMCQEDCQMAHSLYYQAAKAFGERLRNTRIQLAAARA